MQTYIIAVFQAPSEAATAFSEVRALGAHSSDVSVFAFRDAENPPDDGDHDDGRLDFVRPLDSEEKPQGETPETPVIPDAEDLPTFRTPFGDTPGGVNMGLPETLPEDLFLRLKAVGVGEQSAVALHEAVAAGHAVMLVATPSGTADASAVWRTLERCGAKKLARVESGATAA